MLSVRAGDLGEGHEITRGGGDAHPLDVVDMAAMIGRVAHHDLHVLAAALDLPGLEPVEGRAHLCGQRPGGQPQRPGGLEQLDLHLASSRIEVIHDVVDTLELGEVMFDRVRDGGQMIGVAPADLDVDGGTTRSAVDFAERELLDAGNVAGLLPDLLEDLVAGPVALFDGSQLDVGLRQMRLRGAGHAGRR